MEGVTNVLGQYSAFELFGFSMPNKGQKVQKGTPRYGSNLTDEHLLIHPAIRASTAILAPGRVWIQGHRGAAISSLSYCQLIKCLTCELVDLPTYRIAFVVSKE